MSDIEKAIDALPKVTYPHTLVVSPIDQVRVLDAVLPRVRDEPVGPTFMWMRVVADPNIKDGEIIPIYD